MIHCPDCGAEHFPGTLFCDTCGAAVHPAAQAHLAAARDAAGRPTGSRPAATLRPSTAAAATPQSEPLPHHPVAPARDIQFHLPRHDATFTVNGALLHIGRADPDDGFFPEVDLTDYSGQERGVSRRHATIQWVEGGYVITDQHSSNGTWLDGVRLVAGYAYQIPPGATVRFGGLLVQLTIAN